ncbi:MAG: acetyltransferase [Bacteroidales bacterium]
MKQKIVLIGGGGHCKSCIDVIESTGYYKIAGILDRPEVLDQPVLNYIINGTDDDIALLPHDTQCLVTVGQLKSANLRKHLYEQILKEGLTPATVISPQAIVSKYAQIGSGTIVHHGAVINVNAYIGSNCIINSMALVEHDVRIGNHTHIATGARINGSVEIGESCLIGSGSVVIQGISIADHVIIGAGSVVTHSINEPGIYFGNPAKKKETNE